MNDAASIFDARTVPDPAEAFEKLAALAKERDTPITAATSAVDARQAKERRAIKARIHEAFVHAVIAARGRFCVGPDDIARLEGAETLLIGIPSEPERAPVREKGGAG